MRVLFFGTYNTETTPRVQVLLEGLRAHGAEVLECNVPLKVSTAERVQMLRQPWRLPLLAWRILSCWWRLWRRVRALPKPDAVVVGYLGQFDIHLARWLFRGVPLVLDCMVTLSGAAVDRQLQGRGNLKMKLVQWVDQAAWRRADIVVMDTLEHQNALSEEVRAKSLVVHVGASEGWFTAAKQTSAPKNSNDTKASKDAVAKQSAPLKVFFVGVFTPLQGAPTIGRALARVRQPMDVTMAGTGQDFAATQKAAAGSRANITWTPWIKGADLPAFAATQDVCLGIFGTTAKAQNVIPNKVYQGAAADTAIITSDTPPQRRVLGDSVLYVPAGDDKALATALDRLAKDRGELARLCKASAQLAAQEFTPKAVTKSLFDKLQNNEANPRTNRSN